MSLSARAKFIKWYVRPYNRLKRVRGGDGAFVAMAIALPLCERYYRIKSHTVLKYWKTEPLIKKAAKDFKVEARTFRHFWHVYRNGIQHQGSPKRRFKDAVDKKFYSYKWAIDAKFEGFPEIKKIKGKRTICINPWTFTSIILKRFLKKPKYLEKSVSHAFGSLISIEE